MHAITRLECMLYRVHAALAAWRRGRYNTPRVHAITRLECMLRWRHGDGDVQQAVRKIVADVEEMHYETNTTIKVRLGEGSILFVSFFSIYHSLGVCREGIYTIHSQGLTSGKNQVLSRI